MATLLLSNRAGASWQDSTVEYFPAHANTMADLIQRTNLRWCGYYLDAPSQRLNTGWLGERNYLDSLGWNIAPLYVGQQDPSYNGGDLSYNPSSARGYRR